jgi:hypothetical protein
MVSLSPAAMSFLHATIVGGPGPPKASEWTSGTPRCTALGAELRGGAEAGPALGTGDPNGLAPGLMRRLRLGRWWDHARRGRCLWGGPWDLEGRRLRG